MIKYALILKLIVHCLTSLRTSNPGTNIGSMRAWLKLRIRSLAQQQNIMDLTPIAYFANIRLRILIVLELNFAFYGW